MRVKWRDILFNLIFQKSTKYFNYMTEIINYILIYVARSRRFSFFLFFFSFSRSTSRSLTKIIGTVYDTWKDTFDYFGVLQCSVEPRLLLCCDISAIQCRAMTIGDWLCFSYRLFLFSRASHSFFITARHIKFQTTSRHVKHVYRLILILYG